MTEPTDLRPGPPSRDRTRSRRLPIAVGGLLAVAALLVGGVAVAAELAPPRLQEETLVLDAREPRLTVDIGNGDLSLVQGDGARVEIRRTVRVQGWGEPTFSEDSTGDGVTIAAECSRWWGLSCEID
ncbi:hypothetical protein [Pseudonocardia nigra]|uniref:hypothetical protein n=1 Tax=Pseudonocardia nigra TaxID=1921578 RepID=UPI001C607607|nr:hypothetical protein [Pseudonocardia nigra]